jgi:hypothetical protein
MSITALAVNPNPTIQIPGLNIYTGVVECVFKGEDGSIARDTLSFVVTDPPISLVVSPVQASCVVSLASFGYDGPVTDALWAVDSVSVNPINEDRGSGTAQLQVSAALAVKGLNGFIVRVNYSIFVKQ